MLPVALYAKIVNDWFRDISTHTPLAGRDHCGLIQNPFRSLPHSTLVASFLQKAQYVNCFLKILSKFAIIIFLFLT